MKTPLIGFKLTVIILGGLLPASLDAAPTTAARDAAQSHAVLPEVPASQAEATVTAPPRVSMNTTQDSTSMAKPVASPAPQSKATTAEARSAAALGMSTSPTFDEGSGRRIQQAILSYSAIAAEGGWQPIPAEAKFSIGSAGPHDELLRRRLVISSDLAALEASGPFNSELVAGLKRFQIRHGIAATGAMTLRTVAALNVPVDKRIQQLEASAKRIATIGFGFGERYVVVNLPAAHAEAVENDQVVRRYRVIVGKTEKPSPTVTASISEINLNPAWTVPASITKNEIAAHMRKDVTYLSRNHMQVFDSHDAVIDSGSIDWSVGKAPHVVVRQAPGPWNALGQVRINMPNSYAVYMHDTNQKILFSDEYRFDSHGCVRVDNVRDFAAWLLQEEPDWSRAEIDTVIATGQRHDIKLQKKVPVAWIYLTAWMSRDHLVQFRNDVYDQDQQLVEATAEEKTFFDQAEQPKLSHRAH